DPGAVGSRPGAGGIVVHHLSPHGVTRLAPPSQEDRRHAVDRAGSVSLTRSPPWARAKFPAGAGRLSRWSRSVLPIPVRGLGRTRQPGGRGPPPEVANDFGCRCPLGAALEATSVNQRPPLLAGLVDGHGLAISDRALVREDISFDQPVFDPTLLDLL